MTKRNLLLVSLLLAFGLAALPSSLFAVTGIVWSTSTNVNEIRTEGDAEAVGTIGLAATTSGTILYNSRFTIQYNLPIAVTHSGEYGVGIGCSTGMDGALCTALSTPGGITVTNTATTGTVTLAFTYAGDHSGIFVNVGDTIYIAVRVKAQGLPSGANVTANVKAFYQFSNAPITISSTSLTTLQVATCGGIATTVALTEGPADVLTCIGVHKIKGTVEDNDFELEITENWPDALTSLSDEYNLENNNSSNLAGDPSFNIPTNGSNILIILSGVPSTVGVEADPATVCDPSTQCVGGNLNLDPPVAIGATVPYGNQAFWYMIESTSVSTIEWAWFGFHLWSQGPLMPNQNYQITAQVQLTDIEPTGYPITQPVSANDMPWFSLPEETPGFPVVDFYDCVTNLLFPYINTVQAGGTNVFNNFDTGMVFANTTWDPFALPSATCVPATGVNCTYPTMAKGSAIPQNGSCTIYFYPHDGSTTVVYPTGTINAGNSLAIYADKTSGFVNNWGYAIAVCGFQNAYGFADIWDGSNNPLTVGPGTTLGYLAYILPNPGFYHRSPAGDGLGESAIAPYDINKKLEKYLMGIEHHHH